MGLIDASEIIEWKNEKLSRNLQVNNSNEKILQTQKWIQVSRVGNTIKAYSIREDIVERVNNLVVRTVENRKYWR